MAGHSILSVAYGIDVRPQGDPFVEGGENMLRAMGFASTSEASLFDMIPWRIIYCPFSKMCSTDTPCIYSNPYAGLVSRSGFQTSCAQVAPRSRQ